MQIYHEAVPMPKSVAEKRLNICKSCKKYKLGICLHCGCLMTLKTKIQHEECPENKWKFYTPEIKIKYVESDNTNAQKKS